jgi:hypothetical protein
VRGPGSTSGANVIFAGAGEGNRTLVFSLEGCCSTIELHPRGADYAMLPCALQPAPSARFCAQSSKEKTCGSRVFLSVACSLLGC